MLDDAIGRFDRACLMQGVANRATEHRDTLVKMADDAAYQASTAVLRLVMLIGDPSAEPHENEEDRQPCSILIDGRVYSAVPANAAARGWGASMMLAVTQLAKN